MINFHRSGMGPPLVLIHGVGHHWQSWQPVIDRLEGEFDAIALDSPGFGRSTPLDGDLLTVPAYTDAIAAWIEALGLEAKPHVAGNSMGGAIALELARRGVVASAAAFSPAGFWTPTELAYATRSLVALGNIPAALRRPIRAALRTGAGRRVLLAQVLARGERMPAEEAILTLDDLWASPVFEATVRAFEGYSFAAIEELPPVTVAWGNKDRLLLYARQSARARAALPKARHVTLGAGHTPHYDDPGAVAQVIRNSVR